MSRVVLAMSGGVDSSVAAHLLQQEGHEVIGVFMRHGHTSPACGLDSDNSASSLPQLPMVRAHKQGCCSASDAEDARKVADRLDIPFYALNLEEEFGAIIDYFVAEYRQARTPNPCVMCNHQIKFGKLFDYADSVGAEFVATGHYARLVERDLGKPPALCCGIDSLKDQSYVLFGIQKELLSRMLLPVGGFEKPKIRELAGVVGLDVATKKDSQEICFVTSGRHDEFVRAYPGDCDTSGEIVTVGGQVVGTHPGIERFTIGQRKGLGVAMGEPYFVVRIDPESYRVTIGQKEDLARTELTADRTNWLVDMPATPFRCTAKIRYNGAAVPATAEQLPDSRLRVRFDESRFGVAPGQAVVCYGDDRVLGGGWIE